MKRWYNFIIYSVNSYSMFFSKYPRGFYIETMNTQYKETDPVFFDTSAFEWCRRLEMVAPQLIQELQPVLGDTFDGLITNPEESFQFPPRIWKAFSFYFNGFKINRHLMQFPFLASELEKIPNLITATISVMEPGSYLLPHNGSTNGVMRYHLGLNIPAPMPDCGFIISGHELSWEVGKSFMFCDMMVHSARNRTNKRRHILMLDVVRPEFAGIKRKICVLTIARILTNHTADYFRKIFQRAPKLVDQDPTKELKYEPNKPGPGKREEKINWSKLLFTHAEHTVFNAYVAFLSVLFCFKKMQ